MNHDDRGLLIAFPVWAHFGITGRTEMIRLLVKLRQPRPKRDTVTLPSLASANQP